MVILFTNKKINYRENNYSYESKIDCKIKQIGDHPMIDITIGNKNN